MSSTRKPERAYHYRGSIETGPRYIWKDGYSAGDGRFVMFPWMTRQDCRANAKRDGFRATFYRDGIKEKA